MKIINLICHSINQIVTNVNTTFFQSNKSLNPTNPNSDKKAGKFLLTTIFPHQIPTSHPFPQINIVS